jgi:hypothetical protein
MKKVRRNFIENFTGPTEAFAIGGILPNWPVPIKKAGTLLYKLFIY